MRHTSHHSAAPGYQHESRLGGSFHREASPWPRRITAISLAALAVELIWWIVS